MADRLTWNEIRREFRDRLYRDIDDAAPWLVPPDHLILPRDADHLSPETKAALRRLIGWWSDREADDDDKDRIAALLEPS